MRIYQQLVYFIFNVQETNNTSQASEKIQPHLPHDYTIVLADKMTGET